MAMLAEVSEPDSLTFASSDVKNKRRKPGPFREAGFCTSTFQVLLDLAEEGLAGGHEVVCGFLETGGNALSPLAR